MSCLSNESLSRSQSRSRSQEGVEVENLITFSHFQLLAALIKFHTIEMRFGSPITHSTYSTFNIENIHKYIWAILPLNLHPNIMPKIFSRKINWKFYGNLKIDLIFRWIENEHTSFAHSTHTHIHHRECDRRKKLILVANRFWLFIVNVACKLRQRATFFCRLLFS